MTLLAEPPTTATPTHQFLRRGLPFSRMDETHVAWMAERIAEERFADGDIILAPGQTPDRLYFLASGMVRLEAIGETVSQENRVLAELIEGESFPVEALHDQRPVFSTFRAVGDVLCYTLGVAAFVEMEASSEVFRKFCEDRAAAFLDFSRRIYHTHFSRRTEDTALLTARLSSLKCQMPDTAGPDTPVRAVIALLNESGRNAVVVLDADQAPLGVFALKDLLGRVLLTGGSLDQPVREVMSRQLVALPPDADGYEAALAMAKYGVKQVLIVGGGRLVGAVTERDLFSLQRVGLSQISARIRQARDLPALQYLTGEIRVLTGNLMSQGVAAEPLMRIISSLNDRLTHRIIELEVEAAGGPLPRFCWIAIGSEGRHEQTLSTDQDNGIIFEAASTDTEAVRARLLPLAQRINQALATCGFPICKGGVMAGNPQWCLSLDEWRTKFSDWMYQPEPEAVLNASIFFDFRPIYGDDQLSLDLSEWLLEKAPQQDRFFHNFVDQALQRTPPIGFFRDFVVDKGDADQAGTVDLKLAGATLFVDAARILGLKSGVAHSNTAKRLTLAADVMGISRAEADAWVEAFHFIQLLRLRRQHELIEQGEEPHNRIDPYELNELDRKVFLEALRQARKLQKSLELRFAHGRPF